MGVGAPTTRWARKAGKKSPTKPSSGLQRTQHDQRLDRSISAIHPTSGKKTNSRKVVPASNDQATKITHLGMR
jgi:hypothetical protein